MDFVTFHFRIKYNTGPGEEIYIYGDSPDFGNWQDPKFKLNWSEGNIWIADYQMQKSSKNIEFKFVYCWNDGIRWEDGDNNRLLSPQNLNGLSKTSDGKYILDCVWNQIVPSNPNGFMQVGNKGELKKEEEIIKESPQQLREKEKKSK